MAEKRLLILGKNGSGSGTQVQSDWAETNTESVSYIKNKPNISDAEIVIKQNNVTKGSFTLNQNGPATINLEGGSGGGSTQVQSDWAETDTEAVSYIKNKPSLATVATTGSYSDLSGTPSLSNVATSGNYDDLLNKPTIPDAQVNSDWNAESGISQILNKPTLSIVATSGNYDDLLNKPTIPSPQVNSDWNANSGISQILNKPTLSIVATSGSFNDLTDKPTIPDAQVNSDWNASSGISQILNKPNMTTQTLTFVDENNVETNVIVYTQPTV